jgi:hypothetical protein
MTKVFGYELPDQCRNCERLNLHTAIVAEKRDTLDPETVSTTGDYSLTVRQLTEMYSGALCIAAALCPGTANPDRDELQTCGLDILTTPEAD